MVSWNDLSKIIEQNADRHQSVARFDVRMCDEFEQIGIHVVKERIKPTVRSTEPPRLVLELIPPAPPVPKVPASAAPAPPVPNVPAPAPRTVSASAPKSAKYQIDPVILGIEEQDPLYADAPYATKHKMEIEEAVRIEAILDELYKSASGRSRGWTKVGLNAMIKPRCASGGDIKEIDRAKKAFIWALVCSDKPTAAFLDFLCVAKKIRVAVWSAEKKLITLFPAADAITLDESDTKPIKLYHVDDTGHPKHVNFSCKDVLEFCDSNKWSLLPPSSVMHSLAGLNMDELESVGTKLGMTEVVGSKAERISSVAQFKLRKRLMDGAS